MIEHHLDLAAAEGAMNSFVVHPEEGGRFPVVLFYMDTPGKREELHDMAWRIATVGCFVVLPNLYYRLSRDFESKERTEPALAGMFALMATLHTAITAIATQALLDFLDRQPAADAGRTGAVGYCMSGSFQVGAAGRSAATAGRAAVGRHVAPRGVLPGGAARLRVSAARRHLRAGGGGTALGAPVQPVRAHASPKVKEHLHDWIPARAWPVFQVRWLCDTRPP